MIRKLIDENKNAYKAALHVHTTISDGRMTPEAVRDAYYQAWFRVTLYDHAGKEAHTRAYFLKEFF